MDSLTMEEHLKVLLRNTSAQRYKTIQENVQLALDTLETQKVSYAFKAWQIREKCVSVLKEALESNNPTLVSIGLRAIEHAVFHPDLDGITGEDEWDAMDARIFVLQVLDSLKCMPHLEPVHQVQGLKILLGLCCDFVPSFDGELIIKIVQMCLACRHKDHPANIETSLVELCAAYALHTQQFCAASCARQNVNSDVHGAAESLASQAVEKLAKADIHNEGMLADKLADVIGLAKFFVQQTNRAESDSQRGLYLECLLSVLKALKSPYIRKHDMFCNLVRQDLCPCLATVICMTEVAMKTRPLRFKKYKKKKKSRSQKNGMVTRSVMLHRKVAMLSVELVRLVGCVASLRPHIAVVFTHLLSDVATSKHGIPYMILKQLWQTPDILYDLAGPFLVQDMKEKQNVAGILQLIIHTMSTSCDERLDQSSQLDNIQASVLAVNCLLESLDAARQGEGLRDEQVAHYFQSPTDLSDAEVSSDAGESSYEDVVLAEEDSLKMQESEEGVEEQEEEEDDDDDVEENEIIQEEEHKQHEISYQNYAPKSLSEFHRGYLSDEDDIWMSSEDLRTPSSPCYQSANEEEVATSTPDVREEDGNLSSISTNTTSDVASFRNDGYDSDGDIEKYIEETVLPNGETLSLPMSDRALEERNRILARRHIKYIGALLPKLLECTDVATLDQCLQQAASQFCHEIYASWKVESLSIQADSLYILSYATLLLSLRLHLNGHYTGAGVQLPCVKSQWVDFQQTSGVYLGKAWLSETFKQILTMDMFGEAGYDDSDCNTLQPPLIITLTEIDGVLQREQGIGFSPVHIHSSASLQQQQAVKAGSEFARQLSVSSWNLILDVLQFSFGLAKEAGFSNALFLVFSPASLRMRSSREHDVIITSLEGLRAAVKLSCALGIPSYSGNVLAQMVEACVPDNFSGQRGEHQDALRATDEVYRSPDLRLHMCHVLCMDSVLDVALRVGCHAPSKWKALFRLVTYVAHLETACFNSTKNNRLKQEKVQQTDTSIAALVKENSADIKWGKLSSGEAKLTSIGFLTHERTTKAVCVLAEKIDHLFEQASVKLNLRNMVNFIWYLGQASREQLYNVEKSKQEKLHVLQGNLLLFRLGECALKCVKSTNRPLLHIGSVWNMCAPHFAKAAGHPDVNVAKQAITFIHDTVSVVLNTSQDDENDHRTLALWSDKEPHYFHFSEALLQPFERAMQLEACIQPVQDQIACSISQLVEASSIRIASGWRPLFNALRSISFAKQDSLKTSPVLDVLNSFFAASQSPSVFANAAHDCIKCLLKMLATVEDGKTEGQTNEKNKKPTSEYICRYLEDIHNIMMSMRESEILEKFHNSAHIDVTPACSGDGSTWQYLVTPQWVSDEDQTVEEAVNKLERIAKVSFADEQDAPSSCKRSPPVDHCLHDTSGLLPTWFTLLDGLASSVLPSNYETQPVALDLLCRLLEKIWTNPGPIYCLHILLHSCLPSLHSWMSRITSDVTDRDVINMLAGYKHMFGTIMEYVADVLHRHLLTLATESSNKDEQSGGEEATLLETTFNRLWTAYLNLCIHAIRTRKEHLAKLGCACLRHILTTTGELLTPSMISDACRCICYVVDDCLVTIGSLVTLFDDDLQDQLLVELKDSGITICDPSCLSRVFQSSSLQSKGRGFEPHSETYLIYSSREKFHRVSLCNLSCDLSSLHLLVNCIHHLMLGNSTSPWKRDFPISHHNRQQNNNSDQNSTTSLLHSSNEKATNQSEARAKDVMLGRLQSAEIHNLCACVVKCFAMGRNFDRHRNLQRLLQKLGKFYSSANLYQFTSLSFDTYLRIILTLCSHFTIPATSSTATSLPRLPPPPNSVLRVEDILPNLSKLHHYHLKSAESFSGLTWVLTSLGMSLGLLSSPWGEGGYPASPRSVEQSETFYILQERSSLEKRASSDPVFEEEARVTSDEMSDTKSDTRSISLDMDYMAYVKKTHQENPDNGQGSKMEGTITTKHNSNTAQIPGKSSTGRRMYSVAGEKTIGRLISAYKKHKQHQGATTIVQQQNKSFRGSLRSDSDIVSMPSSPGGSRSRTVSESSTATHSALPYDEREMEREAWCVVVSNTLRLLTTAPDPILNQLLPVVYQPLAALARQPSSTVTQESHCDVGDAFHQWLLRVGDLCHFLAPQQQLQQQQ